MNETRWQRERSDADARDYVQRFRSLSTRGVDTDGEARFVDAVLAPHSSVLDAGCGTGRVGRALLARGHSVSAVDLDPILIEEARTVPGLDVHLGDLVTLDLGRRYDAVVAAGNVMVYLATGTERIVLQRLREHLVPDGVLIAGFATDREYSPHAFDVDAEAVGLTVEHRFSTWDLRPWSDAGGWMVVVARA